MDQPGRHLKPAYFLLIVVFLLSCKGNDEFTGGNVGGQNEVANGCEGFIYPNWETSRYVLPYPVGQSFTIGLSHCSGFPHHEGGPDQFAIDFLMDIGTLVTAVETGTIMFVEESGLDFESTNNVVVLRDEDGLFHQYQHLMHNGSLVEQGQFVQKGDPIGFSGASGSGGVPHLHLVATGLDDWMFPYSTSYPITFSNTSSNPQSLIEGETYMAFPYQ